MPKCVSCGDYYRLSPFNQSSTCEDCSGVEVYEEIDPETEIDIRNLKNPSGRILPSFNEVDVEDDSFGF